MAKMFYSLKEAAQKLDTNPDRVMELVRNGQLQEFMDGKNSLFKREQVELLAIDKPLAVIEPEIQSISRSKIDKPDFHGMLMLGVWALCGITFLVGAIGRRAILLETVLPILALTGFILLTFNLVKYLKNRKKEQEAIAREESTEKMLAQIERIKNLGN